jgi:hypothetical protein
VIWKRLKGVLDERPSLYLMTLCSLLIALPEVMYTDMYLHPHPQPSLVVVWARLAILFCINSMIGYILDTYWFKSKSLRIWTWSFCLLFVGVFLAQPVVSIYWCVVIIVTFGGSLSI